MAGEDPPTLFQIGFSEGLALFGPELSAAKKYAGPLDAELMNCVNLSLVYLRLIKNPSEYLETCSSRRKSTEFGEMSETIVRAVESGGGKMAPIRLNETLIRVPVTKDLTAQQGIQTIGEGLLPGYATLLGVEYNDGTKHLVVLRKRVPDNKILYIDPQVYDADGKWPLTRTEAFPSEERIVALYYILGPILPRNVFAVMKYRYDPTQFGKEGILMRVNKGGNRKGRTVRRKARRSSRKHLRAKLKH